MKTIYASIFDDTKKWLEKRAKEKGIKLSEEIRNQLEIRRKEDEGKPEERPLMKKDLSELGDTLVKGYKKVTEEIIASDTFKKMTKGVRDDFSSIIEAKIKLYTLVELAVQERISLCMDCGSANIRYSYTCEACGSRKMATGEELVLNLFKKGLNKDK